MVSGIPTASGYEERIRFSELEVVDAGAIDQGVLHTLPEGHYTNGWDVNVAGVRTVSIKRNIRTHKHAVSSEMRRNDRLLTSSGIHPPCEEERRAGILYWETVRRFCQATQEAAYRVTRKSSSRNAKEEQVKLNCFEFTRQCHWERR